MPPRSGSRELAIILFCVLGIALLNDFSHNKCRGFSDPRPLLSKVFRGKDVRPGYRDMTLYELLEEYASDRKAIEKLPGVAVNGQILPESAVDPESALPGAESKVRETFRLFRRFSQKGTDEGSTTIQVEVYYPKDAGLEPNMWVRVQGPVRPLLGGEESGEVQPRIEAVEVRKLDTPPENPILTPEGEQPAPEITIESGH